MSLIIFDLSAYCFITEIKTLLNMHMCSLEGTEQDICEKIHDNQQQISDIK